MSILEKNRFPDITNHYFRKKIRHFKDDFSDVPRRYNRQLCIGSLLVYKLLSVHILELGSVKAHSEEGAEGSLPALVQICYFLTVRFNLLVVLTQQRVISRRQIICEITIFEEDISPTIREMATNLWFHYARFF